MLLGFQTDLPDEDLTVLYFTMKEDLEVAYGHLQFGELFDELRFGFDVRVGVEGFIVSILLLLLIILLRPVVLLLVELLDELLVDKKVFVAMV